MNQVGSAHHSRRKRPPATRLRKLARRRPKPTGLINDTPIGEMNGAIGHSTVARIARDHANDRAFAVQLLQEIHHSFAILRNRDFFWAHPQAGSTAGLPVRGPPLRAGVGRRKVVRDSDPSCVPCTPGRALLARAFCVLSWPYCDS